ncbi:Autoinducer 2 (AI-2) kinase LsrK [Klebsiella pneumoniae]|nr:Autoinducer 2 (AI-2) kinase LsrK [Klebsiella pneumoniae]
MSYLLALDAGTGSIRAVIFDLNGRQLAVGQAEWKHLSVDNVPGSMEFDLTTNWQLACQCIRQALDAARLSAADIQSVACCSMREGIVLYDRNGEAIWACANVDARASREVAELKEIHGLSLRIRGIRGLGTNPGAQRHAAPAVAGAPPPRYLPQSGNHHHDQRLAGGEAFRRGWLSTRQTPAPPACSICSAATGVRRCLIWPGCAPICCRRSKRPVPCWAPSPEAAAQQSGLRAGTPVVMGGGDVQLGCLGLGVVRAGQTAVLGGTFWQQVVNLPQVRTDPQMNIRVNPHVIPGMAQAESISFFTGLTMRWFRDAFCAEEKLIAERLGVDAYSLLEEMASRVPAGSHGVMPIFSDAMHFKQWYHRRAVVY